jgi:hypothetical protein
MVFRFFAAPAGIPGRIHHRGQRLAAAGRNHLPANNSGRFQHLSGEKAAPRVIFNTGPYRPRRKGIPQDNGGHGIEFQAASGLGRNGGGPEDGKKDAAPVMSAYNLYKGVHCGCRDCLLRKVLKEEWDFDSFVMGGFI